mgnify:CR=1 FL=1
MMPRIVPFRTAGWIAGRVGSDLLALGLCARIGSAVIVNHNGVFLYNSNRRVLGVLKFRASTYSFILIFLETGHDVCEVQKSENSR